MASGKRRHRHEIAARIIYAIALLALAGGGFVGIVLSVHDYPLTRAAFATYLHGGDRFWRVSFAFVNEAGAGIKAAIGWNPGRYRAIPQEFGADAVNRNRRQASLAAQREDWNGNLVLAHTYALGWGVASDRQLAADLYLRGQAQAAASGEYDAWIQNTRRITVEALLLDELAALRMLRQLNHDLELAQENS